MGSGNGNSAQLKLNSTLFLKYFGTCAGRVAPAARTQGDIACGGGAGGVGDYIVWADHLLC